MYKIEQLTPDRLMVDDITYMTWFNHDSVTNNQVIQILGKGINMQSVYDYQDMMEYIKDYYVEQYHKGGQTVHITYETVPHKPRWKLIVTKIN